MDDKQHSALQPFDEAWFDVVNSCGKEFELPKISTPINPQWSDNENLVFLEDQQPDILENSYELVMTSSWCSGNVVDSFPPLKMVPAITNYVLTVDMQEGISFGNHMVHFLEEKQLVSMPTPAIISSLRNQEFNFNSINSPMISSDSSSHLVNNPTHASRFTNNPWFGSNIYPLQSLLHQMQVEEIQMIASSIIMSTFLALKARIFFWIRYLSSCEWPGS